jgi:hypothetical protein
MKANKSASTRDDTSDAVLQAVARAAGGLAHDINNHLTPILAYARMVEMEVKGGAAAEFVRELVRSAESLSEYAGSLQDLHGRSPSRPCPVSVNRVLRDAIPALVKELAENRITIETNLSDEDGVIEADEVLFARMVHQIGLGARDSLAGGGVLRLRTQCEPAAETGRGSVVLEVEDNGPPFAPDDFAHLYEPYYPVQGRRKGRGWGLCMLRLVSAKCGGSLTVENAPTAGTRLTLRFPRIQAPAQMTSVGMDATRPLNAPLAVVVAADPALRRRLMEGVALAGGRAFEAAGREEAIDLCGALTDPIRLLIAESRAVDESAFAPGILPGGHRAAAWLIVGPGGTLPASADPAMIASAVRAAVR